MAAFAVSANGEIGFAVSAPSIDIGQGPITGSGPSLFVGKLDANGVAVDARPLAAAHSPVYGMAMDACGGITLAAVTGGEPDFGSGPMLLNQDDVYVALASYAPNLSAVRRLLPGGTRIEVGDVGLEKRLVWTVDDALQRAHQASYKKVLVDVNLDCRAAAPGLRRAKLEAFKAAIVA